MARKKPHFQWTAEDGEAPPLGERRDREARVAMARRLEALPEGILRQLPIDDAQVEAILHLARLGPQSAHRRQMLRVQVVLCGAMPAVHAMLCILCRSGAELRLCSVCVSSRVVWISGA